MDSTPEEFIQGVGNEVFYFFLLVSCLLLLVGSWFSTQVVEPVVSSVILVERTELRRIGSRTRVGQERRNEYLQLSQDPESTSISSLTTTTVITSSSTSSSTSTSSSVPSPQEENLQIAPETEEVNETFEPEAVASDVVEAEPIPQEERVTIRLKFLNDTHREVEASLLENIGNFKRRNFTVEISEDKNVRLIFNGQVLREDTQTLRSYGIFDKCVVHCLIHQQSNQTAPPPPRQEQDEIEEDLDMSELFIPILGVGLIFLWYTAFTYSNYFNLMSSTALLGLSSIFLLSVYGTNFHVNVAVGARE